jgi:DNA-binding IclR family transcriptional regulator
MPYDTPAATAVAPSVLWKAFDVLETFNQSRRVMTLSEIARKSGLPKSTTHRILTMLLEVDAVQRVGQDYRIGLRIFTMGTCSAEVQLRNVALPHLERLRRVTKQTVHLAVIEEADVVYLEKLPSAASPSTPAVVGGRLPARSTGVGKALLAFTGPAPESVTPLRNHTSTFRRPGLLRSYLQDVRMMGIAADREEAAPGLACVAAPIFVGHQAVAAVSVAFTASAGSGESFVNPLRETSAAIGRALAMTSSRAP